VYVSRPARRDTRRRKVKRIVGSSRILPLCRWKKGKKNIPSNQSSELYEVAQYTQYRHTHTHIHTHIHIHTHNTRGQAVRHEYFRFVAGENKRGGGGKREGKNWIKK